MGVPIDENIVIQGEQKFVLDTGDNTTDIRLYIDASGYVSAEYKE